MGKKIAIGFGILLVVITAVYFLWPDPIKKDIDLFVDEYNASVVTCHDTISTELKKFNSNSLISDFEKSVNQVMIPQIDGAIAKLQVIPLQTADVMLIRNKYVQLMEDEKDCMEKIVAALRSGNQQKLEEVYVLSEEIQTMKSQYDQELFSLAEKHKVYLRLTTQE